VFTTFKSAQMGPAPASKVVQTNTLPMLENPGTGTVKDMAGETIGIGIDQSSADPESVTSQVLQVVAVVLLSVKPRLSVPASYDRLSASSHGAGLMKRNATPWLAATSPEVVP
jgi:hypothetical protein